MENNTPIDDAIHAHTQWFVRLRLAIEQGTSEFKPVEVSKDNNCAFGKWLYGDFPVQHKGSILYKEIKELHARFHLEAGRILKLALENKKQDAMNAMALGGDLRKISSALISKLNALKKEA